MTSKTTRESREHFLHFSSDVKLIWLFCFICESSVAVVKLYLLGFKAGLMVFLISLYLQQFHCPLGSNVNE